MSYVTPKTNWQGIDVPRDDDFNRIEGNIKHVKDNTYEKSQVYSKLETNSTAEIDNKDQAILQQAKDYINTIEVGTPEVNRAAIRGDANVLLVVEVRTSDPVSPAVGRIWLNTSAV